MQFQICHSRFQRAVFHPWLGSPAGLLRHGAATRQLRRSGLLVANGSHPRRKPHRGGIFGLDAAPTELWFLVVRYLQRCRPAGAEQGAIADRSALAGFRASSGSIVPRWVLRSQPRAGPVRFGCDWGVKFLTVRNLITRWARRSYVDVSVNSLQCGSVGPAVLRTVAMRRGEDWSRRDSVRIARRLNAGNAAAAESSPDGTAEAKCMTSSGQPSLRDWSIWGGVPRR